MLFESTYVRMYVCVYVRMQARMHIAYIYIVHAVHVGYRAKPEMCDVVVVCGISGVCNV